MTDRETSFFHRYRYAIVLVASLLLAVAQPLLSGLMGETGSFDLLFSLLIVAVLFQVFEESRLRRIALSLGVAVFCGYWMGRSISGSLGHGLVIGAQLTATSFFALALYSILTGIFTRPGSRDAVFGAICGYLLLGVIGSLLFFAVETAWPGSFHPPVPSGDYGQEGELDRGVLTYFSFITMTTVGYGDITPATRLARTLTWIVAVAGQLYLAILVAGLVGFRISRAVDGTS